ncbi:MAG: hypothetical protein AAF591_06110 [Verrucomicrobiota bacterium]
MSSSEPSEIDIEAVRRVLHRTVPVTPIDILSDALSDGLSMAMIPLRVDWTEEDVADPVIHRVNVGSNPVTGRLNFGSFRVPLDRVSGAELVTVNVKAFGMDTPAAHCQLRFLFEDGEGPAMVDMEGNIFEPAIRIPDLIISWEAWRRPGQGFNFKEGLDEATYALTPRAYEGAQRFLEDGLKDLSWNCRPLDLPGGRESYRELLLTALQAADGMTRSQVANRLEWDAAEDLDDDTRRGLEEWAREAPGSNEAIDEILGGDLSYQLLKRSCITMAFFTVDLCLKRMHLLGRISERPEIKVLPNSLPDWLDGLAHAKGRTLGRSLGKIIRFVHQNSTVVPGLSYRILEDAGLLRRENGKTVVHHYFMRSGKSPYGSLKDRLIE